MISHIGLSCSAQVMAKGTIFLSGQKEIRNKGVYNTFIF